jgi:hypothetical protein
VTTRLVQNTCTRNKRKTINNYLKYVPSKKRGHPAINSNDILLAITKDDNIFQLQGLLEHNDFTCKHATNNQVLDIHQSNIFQ